MVTLNPALLLLPNKPVLPTAPTSLTHYSLDSLRRHIGQPFGGAVATANAPGLAGAAATTSALATLGGGAVAAGGGRMIAGVGTVAAAAAWPAALVGVGVFGTDKAVRYLTR